jgi:hypothetical protein
VPSRSSLSDPVNDRPVELCVSFTGLLNNPRLE